MLLLFIIPILAAGFYHQVNYPPSFIKLHRHKGQLLYLRCLTDGLYYFSFALVLVFIANQAFVGIVDRLLTTIGDMKMGIESFDIRVAWFVIISVLTMGFAVLRCKLIRLKLAQNRKRFGFDFSVEILREIMSDSPMDEFLLRALIFKEPVLITLSSRKVYVGIVSSMGEPTEHEGMDQEISIIPVFSGYRDKDDLGVELDCDYTNLNHQAFDKPVLVIIKQEQIETLSAFDADLYEQTKQRATKS